MHPTNLPAPLPADPLVCVRVAAFNQASFIRQCLDGIVSQQTDFPFVAVVHDDASTDGTAEIIKEYAARYPQIILPLYEEHNLYSRRDGSLGRLLDSHTYGKYLAMCEGDDYWIDPRKLQRQVDYLEAHPDCVMVYTRVRNYDNETGQFAGEAGSETDGFDSLMESNVVPTLSVVMRCDTYRGYREWIGSDNKGWLMGDYPLWLYCSMVGRIHFMPEVTAVYRILPESASHSKSWVKRLAFVKSFVEIQQYFSTCSGWGSRRPVSDYTQKLLLATMELRLAARGNDGRRLRECRATLRRLVDAPVEGVSPLLLRRARLLVSWPRLGALVLNLRKVVP